MRHTNKHQVLVVFHLGVGMGRGWGGWGGFELQVFLQISGFKFMVSDFATRFVSREVEAKTTDPAVCNWCLESNIMSSED